MDHQPPDHVTWGGAGVRVAFLAVLAVLSGLVVWTTVGTSGAPTEESSAEQAERSGRERHGAGGTTVRGRVDGQRVRVTIPAGPEQPRGLVVWFHGQGGDVDAKADGRFLGALVGAGYAVASSDFHAESWGNSASTRDTAALTAWATEQVAAPLTLWVSGSMGGATSLNALVHGVEPPPCWYGVKPAIALTEMDAVPTATRYIRQAYDGPVPVERNPVRNIADLPRDVRYRVVASPDDTWVPLRPNGGALLSRLDARGVDVSYRLVRGPHSDPSHWDGEDLVAFADSCA